MAVSKFLCRHYIVAFSLGQVHTTPEKFENGVFTLRTHQRFSVHTTPEELKNGVFTLRNHEMFAALISPEKLEKGVFTLAKNSFNVFCPHCAGHFRFVFEENLVREIT